MDKSHEKYTDKEGPFPVLYSEKGDCCGCTACFAVCPKGSISMIRDEEGFEYPQVNTAVCIRCYQCLKVCPCKQIN